MHAYDLPLPSPVAFDPAALPTSRSPWRCRKDSTTKPVRFAPMTIRQATKVWHKARRFERQTRQPGRQDGAIGRNGLAVLHALLFDFMNYATGRLMPSHAAIADKAAISVRSVIRGLKALRAAGLVNWVRRCIEAMIDGRFTLQQEPNAYAVLPPSQWLGYAQPVEAPPAPPPDPGTWGDHPPLPDALTAACQDRRDGASHSAILAALESDPGDGLANALARFGRGLSARLRGSND